MVLDKFNVVDGFLQLERVLLADGDVAQTLVQSDHGRQAVITATEGSDQAAEPANMMEMFSPMKSPNKFDSSAMKLVRPRSANP